MQVNASNYQSEHVDTTKVTPGAFLALNDDDDNTNSVPDLNEVNAAVTNENDLLEVNFSASGLAPSNRITFSAAGTGTGQLKAWRSALRGTNAPVLDLTASPPVTTYSYEQHTGELLNVDYSDSTPDVTYTYNRLGQQATVADVVGTRTFAYNSALQLAAETVAGSLYNKVLTRQYQASGAGLLPGRPAGFRLGTTADPDADQTVTYGFDALGRLETVSDGTRTFTYSRVADSDLLAGYGSTSFTVAYSYETHRNVRTQVQTKYSTTTLAQFDYATDAVGRRQTREQSGTVFGEAYYNAFDYNARGEVTQSKRFAGKVSDPGAEKTGEDFDYAFDPIGNRQTSNVGNSATPRAYTANQLNQYTALTQPSQSPTHDADGNLTADGTWTYTWDAENRLITAYKTGKHLKFGYDYLGRRVQKRAWDNTDGTGAAVLDQRFVYDGWNLLAILDPQSSILQQFVWGLDLSGSLQGAGGVGGLLALNEIANGQIAATHAAAYDANGNVSALVNLASGTVTTHYEYGPFGEVLAAEGTLATANPFRFSTKFTDDETGLLYYGYRYYLPAWGRWASRDPIGEDDSPALQLFVSNNAIAHLDPDGLEQSHGEAKCPTSSFAWKDYGMQTLHSKEECKEMCHTRKDSEGKPITPERVVPACAKSDHSLKLLCVSCESCKNWVLVVQATGWCKIYIASPTLSVHYTPSRAAAIKHEMCHCEDDKAVLKKAYDRVVQAAGTGSFSSREECEAKRKDIDPDKILKEVTPKDPHADPKYERKGKCYATGDFKS